MPELICKILHIGKTTYYKYLKDNYPIVQFLSELKKEELEELLESGQIKKFNLIKNFTYDELQDKLLNINYDHEFFYANANYKIQLLNVREKAILYHAIRKSSPKTKTELLESVKSLKMTAILFEQFLNIFKKSDSIYDNKIGYNFDQNNLYKIINLCMSEYEVKSFLQQPEF